MGQHFCAIKVRRCGYSEKFAAAGARDTCIVDYDTLGQPIFKRSFYLANSKEDLNLNGIMNKCFNAMDFMNIATDNFFTKNFMLKDSLNEMQREAGLIIYKYKNGLKTKQIKKTGGLVQGIALVKPTDAAGKAGNSLYFEESGKIKFLIKCLNIAQPVVEPQGVVVGNMYAWGTSNTNDADVEGLKKIIYNPQGFNMVKFKNVWEDVVQDDEALFNLPIDPLEFIIDKNSEDYYAPNSGVGWFVPAYDIIDLDEDGVPNRIANIKKLKEKRKQILSGQSNEDALTAFADQPFTISEALIKSSGNEFDSAKLARQLISIESGFIKPTIEKGTLFPLKNSSNKIIGVEFRKSPFGKVHIYKHPTWATIVNGSHQVELDKVTITNLFIAGVDSIDQGSSDSAEVKYESQAKSDFACVVKQRTDPNDLMSPYNSSYVAFIKDRTKDVNDVYEQASLLLLYYNAKALVEYTKLSFIMYMKTNNFINYLVKEPDSPGATIKDYRANKARYGLRATQPIIMFYIDLIKEYIKDCVDRIMFVDILSQLAKYRYVDKTKFDLVAAIGMVECYEADLYKLQPKPKNDKNKKIESFAWVTNSDGSISYQQKSFVKNKEESNINKTYDRRTNQYL
jgi:hypothetical protein